ncbi:MAG: hypothetical protein HYV29_02825 [Ignavibacteriales bacterium]|nr:hypothetical protein [Ignavibacteriales bacterium]
MFRNMSIAAKLFLTFVPIFVVGIAVSVYLNNMYQEEQMQAQALESASQKAHIVRESLVNMMVESQIVDDKYLERVQKVAELNDLYIRIDTAKLHLAEDFMDSTRIVRLWERVVLAQQKDEYDNEYGNEVLATGQQKWVRIGDNFRAMIPFKAEKKCQRCHDVQIGKLSPRSIDQRRRCVCRHHHRISFLPLACSVAVKKIGESNARDRYGKYEQRPPTSRRE